VRAPAEIPHADAVIKSLFDRFKEDPKSAVFGDLAEALLARGHATEALSIAELGLQYTPTSVLGRVLRASALLALARPKVAYLELLRALALDPHHQRALALLGRVYKESGKPAKAAALLAKRSAHAEFQENSESAEAVTNVEFLSTTEMSPTGDASSSERTPIPELFASLTHDLGLKNNAEVPPSDFRPARRRVEVTQIIRTKGLVRRQRTDELSAIDGPIVDTSQPRRIESSPGAGPKKPASAFDVATSPEFHITIDEGQLLEGTPFAVKGVAGLSEDTDTVVDHDVVVGEMPSELDLEVLRRAVEGKSTPAKYPHESKDAFGLRDTVEDANPKLSGDSPANLRPFESARAGRATDERQTDTVPAPPVLSVLPPPAKPKRMFLGLLLGSIIAMFVASMLWFSRVEIRAWLDTSSSGSAASQSPRPQQ
jgi:hypothetical protein